MILYVPLVFTYAVAWWLFLLKKMVSFYVVVALDTESLIALALEQPEEMTCELFL